MLLLTKLGRDIGLLCSDCSYIMKQYPLLLFPVTVLLLMIIACSCCCYSCCSCDGRTDHRRRKIQVRPIAHSWCATRGDTTYYRGHAWTSWFSPMGVTVYTSSLKMAITILINMTQRTRNHSTEFLLPVTTTTGLCGGTRKVKLLYHHCLPLLGCVCGWCAWTHAAEKTDTLSQWQPCSWASQGFPLWAWSHRPKQRTHTLPHARQCLLSSQVANPQGWCWALAKPTDITGRSICSVDLGSSPNLLSLKPPATDTFSWDVCWKQQIVDLQIQMCRLRLWVQLVTNAPCFISLVLQWCEIAKEKNQITCNTLCKQKDESKREKLTNAVA